jgi:hypothetical protein
MLPASQLLGSQSLYLIRAVAGVVAGRQPD